MHRAIMLKVSARALITAVAYPAFGVAAAQSPRSGAPADLVVQVDSVERCRSLQTDTRLKTHSVVSRVLRPDTAGDLVIETVGVGVDPVVSVFSRDSLVAKDDDSGAGLNARLLLPVRAREVYLVCAFSYSESEPIKSIEIHAEYWRGRTARIARRLVADSTMRGELTFEDDTLAGGRFVENWSYSVSSPSRISISLKSTEFDPELALFRAGNSDLPLATDDDGGEGLNSQIERDVQTGEYVVSVRGVNRGSGGEYSLTVAPSASRSSVESLSRPVPGGVDRSRPGVTPASAAARYGPSITVGREYTGTLDDGDPLFSDGSHYDFWTFQAAAGTRYLVMMISFQFQPYCGVGRLAYNEYRFLDGSQTTTEHIAQILLTPEASGPYVIRANSFGSGAKTGSYILFVQRVP